MQGCRSWTHGLLRRDINRHKIERGMLLYQLECVNSYLVLTAFGSEEKDRFSVLQCVLQRGNEGGNGFPYSGRCVRDKDSFTLYRILYIFHKLPLPRSYRGEGEK